MSDDGKVTPIAEARSRRLGRTAKRIERIMKKGEERVVLTPRTIRVDGEDGDYCLADWNKGIKCPALGALRGSTDLYCAYFPPEEEKTTSNLEHAYAYQFLFTERGEVARWEGVDPPRRCDRCLEAERNADIVRRYPVDEKS